MSTMTAVTAQLRSSRVVRLALGVVLAAALMAVGAWLAASGVGLVDAWAQVGTAGFEAVRSTGDAGFQVISERYATPATPPYGQVFARFAAAGAAMVLALRLGLHSLARTTAD